MNKERETFSASAVTLRSPIAGGNHTVAFSWPKRACASLVLMALVVGCASCGGSNRIDPGDLWIRIVSPSAEDSYVSNEANVPLGGSVGGWFILDPAPVIRWMNEATGASGQTGQLMGTWSVEGGVNLQPGANILSVRASNGVQRDAVDTITVTFNPPPR